MTSILVYSLFEHFPPSTLVCFPLFFPFYLNFVLTINIVIIERSHQHFPSDTQVVQMLCSEVLKCALELFCQLTFTGSVIKGGLQRSICSILDTSSLCLWKGICMDDYQHGQVTRFCTNPLWSQLGMSITLYNGRAELLVGVYPPILSSCHFVYLHI